MKISSFHIKIYFFAPLKSSGNTLYFCPSVSDFFTQPSLNLTAVSQHSLSSLSAVSQQSLSSLSALSQQSLSYLVILSEHKILRLVC